MDTRLSEVPVFELFRAETAAGTMTSPAIVIAFNIIKHRDPHYFTTGKALPVDTLYFHRVEEAFCACIVLTAAFCAHAATQIMAFQQCLIIH